MKEHRGLWYPEGDALTKNLMARLEGEEFYRAERFHDAMKHVRQWRGAVDCGAHVGAWSRELAKRFGRVVAIEMHPETAACLKRNLAPWPNAITVNCALGRASGVVGAAMNKGSIDAEVDANRDGEIRLRRLDDLAAGWDMAAIDYLKVHVNGMELSVLCGAEATIRKYRPVMTVVIKRALENYGAKPEDIFNFIGSVGYRVASRLKPYWVFTPQ